MKLIALSIEDLRKIRAAKLDFDGQNLVQVRGRNGAGKSTVIDAIKFLLKGTRDIPANVVTTGQSEAVIIGTIDDYIVKRIIKPDGKSVLAIEREGGKIARPQEFLDAISGQFFDPEQFMSLSPAEKREAIMRYSGIDFTEIDKKIAEAEQERLFVGRELRALGKPSPVQPCMAVNVSELLERRKYIENYNTLQIEAKHKLDEYCTNIARKIANDFVNAAREGVQGLKDALVRASDTLDQALNEPAIPPAPLPLKGYDEIDKEIAEAEETNRRAEQYTLYLAAMKKIEAKEAEYNAAQTKLDSLRKEKSDMLLNAKIPVKGLTLTENGLEHNGISCDNWSTSESLKIGLMLATAYAGELKTIYIKRGESFDAESLATIKNFAEKRNIQVIMEVVDGGYNKDEAGIVWIEEGEIVPPKVVP